MGGVDFSAQSHRANSTVGRLKKRDGVTRRRTFNTDLSRWAHIELVTKHTVRNLGQRYLYIELYNACILIFSCCCVFRSWANAAGRLPRRSSRRGVFPPIRTKQSKPDIFRDGILRSMAGIDSSIFPVKPFVGWKTMSFNTGGEQSPILGPKLRGRVSGVMDTAAMANGVVDKSIDARSLSAGGAAAWYTQGHPFDVIQRWGSWKSMTFHQYLRRDATAIGKQPEIADRSHGLLKCHRLTNNQLEIVS